MNMKITINSLFSLLLLLMVAGAYAALPASVGDKKLPSLAPMLEQTTPAVVNIATRSTQRLPRNALLDDPFFRRFFDIPDNHRERTTQSSGSGVIVNAEQGYIITNFHVIDAADEIMVTLRDGREKPAKLIGTDPQADIAVVQIAVDGLTELPWADSDKLRVGDFVVAIGNPFGLGQTVTSGIVSALGRSGLDIEDFEDFIQTDASINPGNSGGALVDLNGNLVGINTAILGPAGGNVGIGFAIPSNMVRQILQHLIDYGEVRRGRLGISSQDLTPELAQAFGIDNHSGVVIIDVTPKSSAARVGLKRGDIVVSVGGHPVRNADSVRNIMGLLLVGQNVELQIIRGGKNITVNATVTTNEDRLSGREITALLAGARFGNAETRKGRRYVQVIKVEPDSRMQVYGLQKGDIILSVNREAIATVEEMRQAVKLDKKSVLLNVQRGRSAVYVLVQ